MAPISCPLSLVRHVRRREASLDLGQVAPALLQLSGSAIPMPGQSQAGSALPEEGPGNAAGEFGGGAAVAVVGVSPAVTILRTKTRPKKLVLRGSDGGSYTFLLKVRACAGRFGLDLLLQVAECGGPLSVWQYWAARCMELWKQS